MTNKTNQYPERVGQTGDILPIEFTLSSGSAANVDVLSITPETVGMSTPCIIVPGFTEGIVQDAKFGSYLSDDLESQVLVLGQYQRESKGTISSHEALTNQAEALLAVVEGLQLTDGPINIFANSLGALIFARAAEIADARGWTCFKESTGSQVIFMAPAGLKQDDNMPKIAKRFGWDAGLKAHLKEADGWDKDSLKAGSTLISQDPLKAVGEGLAATRLQISFEELAKLDVRPDVITSPQDGVMGQRALGASIIELLEMGHLSSWSTPFSVDTAGITSKEQLVADGVDKKTADKQFFNSSAGAEHNTHMVNDDQAKRTADAVAALLKQLTDSNH